LRGKDQKRAERARSLRRTLTPAEFALWARIRGRQLGGFKFVRQEPIDRYYVDFICRERRLIIELDGGQHLECPEDRQRDSTLCVLGYCVIRYGTTMSLRIWTGFSKRSFANSKNSPSPRPSPRRRGEGASE
jgi:very-short-patch-repair endonuclease